jgi:hypothetical protein
LQPNSHDDQVESLRTAHTRIGAYSGRHIPISITVSSLPHHLVRRSLVTQRRHVFKRRAVDGYEELVCTFKLINTSLLAGISFVSTQN